MARVKSRVEKLLEMSCMGCCAASADREERKEIEEREWETLEANKYIDLQ
jgi:hypothetical protein